MRAELRVVVPDLPDEVCPVSLSLADERLVLFRWIGFVVGVVRFRRRGVGPGMLGDASPATSVGGGDGAIEAEATLVPVMDMGHEEGEELEGGEAAMIGAERRVKLSVVGDQTGVEEGQPLE
jgi:hypothetical protein